MSRYRSGFKRWMYMHCLKRSFNSPSLFSKLMDNPEVILARYSASVFSTITNVYTHGRHIATRLLVHYFRESVSYGSFWLFSKLKVLRMLVLLTYNIIICFDHEREYIWSMKFTFPTYLYFFGQYGTLVSLIIGLTPIFIDVRFPWNHNLHDEKFAIYQDLRWDFTML